MTPHADHRTPLLVCLQRNVPAMRALTSEEWLSVVADANHHHIAAYLRHILKDVAAYVSPPEKVLEALAAEQNAVGLNNLRLYAEFAAIASSLRAESIPVVALKGVYLASYVYADISHRTMGDIDLLVRERDTEKVAEVLSRLCYTPHPSEGPEPWGHHHLPRFLRSGAVPVEIHWSIPPGRPFAVNITDLWNDARTATIAGEEVLVFSHEDLLITLSLHATFHHKLQSGLRPLIDIAECVRILGKEIRWEHLHERARRWRAARCVALTLALAADLVGAPIDEASLRTLDPNILGSPLLRWAKQRVMTRQQEQVPISPAASQLAGNIPLRSKLALLGSAMFPSRREIASMYGIAPQSPSVFFYYPVLMKDLVGRHSRGVWQLLRGNTEAELHATMFREMVDR